MSVTFGQHVCGCGREFSPTPDGRWLHRTLQGHTPTDAPVEPAATITPACTRGDHTGCPERWGGGVRGQRTACSCGCGHPVIDERGPMPRKAQVD